MKQIIILILLLTAYCLSFGQDVKPQNETDLQTQITAMQQGDSAYKAFLNGQKFVWYNAAQGLQKRDSTRFYYPFNSNPAGYLVNPTSLTANFLTYYTGSTFANSNVKYASATGRVGIGFGATALTDPFALEMGYKVKGYNTTDHTTDFQYFELGYTSNTLTLTATNGGAAAVPSINIVAPNSRSFTFAGNSVSTFGVFKMNAATAISTNGASIGGITGSLSASGSGGRQVGGYTYMRDAQSSTAGLSVHRFALYKTTFGSAPRYLVDAGSSYDSLYTEANYHQRFAVDDTAMWYINGVAGTVNQLPISNGVTMTWGLISNANLSNSTISGVALGNNLSSLTASTGITGTAYNGSAGIAWTDDLATGKAGGQSVTGGTASGESLTLVSTTHATKGKIIFGAGGTSAYDGALGFMGVGTASPAALLHLSGNISAANTGASGIALRVDAATYTNTTSSGTVAAYAGSVIAQPTFTANSATTYTLGSTLTIADKPVSSTNVTQTASVSLNVAAGMSALQGGFSTGTSLSGSNLSGGGGSGLSSSTNASLLFGGASTIQARAWANGTTSTVATAGTSIANFIVGAVPVTEATSGTHAIIANVAILAPTVTNGSASTTDGTALYIQGPLTGITPTNPATAMWVASGTARFDGNATFATGISLGLTGKISIAEGTNASVGQATLVGGTVTVSTTAVTANSRIFLTDATTGALTNIGTPTVGTIVAGTSFVINSTNVLDASKVNWFIIN